MLTTRTLPVEEWDRLDETGMREALRYMRPQDVQVIVVEDEGQIVGAWSVIRVTHLEGVWIAPAYRRRTGVARRLLAATFAAARQWRTPWAWTGAQSDDVAALLTEHLKAQRVPMETYVVPLGEC